MGERKGQNFYYPPDFDPKKHGSLNGYHGVHALRERARKLDRGILIIRFEMPYNIWCGGCKNHIGMGVRFNAEKTKLGMYYTTPIYQFRMKCTLCPNHFSIKTDPGNMDYVIVEGARRVEQRWDPTENGQIVPDDKKVGRKLADDAMYKLEHQTTDKDKSADAAPRIGRISQIQDRVKDDYLANRVLRDQFRSKKKERKAKLEEDKKLLSKSGLDLDLVEEADEDVRMARLMNIQARTEAEEKQKDQRGDIEEGDIFGREQSREVTTSSERKLFAVKTVSKAARSKQSDLLKRKGFGLVVSRSRGKETNGDSLEMDTVTNKGTSVHTGGQQMGIHARNIAVASSPTTVVTFPSLSSSTAVAASPPLSSSSSNATIISPAVLSSNSLSLLSCEYGDSEEEDSENE